jgi:hypothetical protein
MTKIKTAKKIRPRKKETIVLRNNEGQELHLPANATPKDLVRLGIDSIRAVPKGQPLPDGWFSLGETAKAEPERERFAKKMLRQAAEAVCGDRNDSYGPPIEDFTTQADMMSAYLSRTNGTFVRVRPSDIAALMAIVKIARQAHQPKADNWVDLAGYAACGAEIDDCTGAYEL